jgi:hypothetical protein
MSAVLKSPEAGHNNPPAGIIDADAAIADARLFAGEFVERRDALLTAYKRWTEQVAGKIEDDTTQGKCADFVKQIGGFLKTVETSRKTVKQPVLDLGKGVDGVFALLSDDLAMAKTAIEKAMTTYATRRAAEEQERVRRESEAAAAAAAMDALIENPEAEIPEAPVEIALPSSAEASRVHGDYGTTASLRGRWVYEVTNAVEIPRHLLMVNDAAVKAAIKAGERDIPGLRIFQEMKVGVR